MSKKVSTTDGIKKELLEYYKNHKSVLLFGKDSIGRTRLVQDVHSESNWKYLDCKNMDLPMIYALVTEREILEEGEYNLGPLKVEAITESLLYDFKGVLFIDNLECGLENYEAIEYSDKLGEAIKNNSLRWLVVYTPSYTDFPEDLKKLFKPVSLVKEITCPETQAGTVKSESIGKVAALEVKKMIEETKESLLYKKTPKDAKWTDLTMAFPNQLVDKVDIVFENKAKGRSVPLKDLGFVDKKATKVFTPLKSLKLLQQFAKTKNNHIPSQKDKKERNKLYSQVRSLRGVLERCFGIDDNPVLSNKEGGYRLQFRAYCYDKKGEEKLLNILRTNLRKLKNETNKTKNVHDDVTIRELKKLIYACVEKYLETNQIVSLKNIICTECYEKIPLCIIDSDNLQVLCSECNQM